MPWIGRLLLPAVLVGIVAQAGGRAAGASTPPPEQARFFEAQVRPVLAEHCAKCHGPKKPKAGLRLDSRSALLAGGDTGPAVVPGKPDESLLIQAVQYEGPEMPPAGRLPKEKVAALTKWVEMGAPWPGGDEASPAPVRRGPLQVTDNDRQHWAFRPVVAPKPPPVEGLPATANPIDAFVLARLQAAGLRPNPPATRAELIRRAHYDLTGLPPSPEAVEAFVADPSPTAYETLVDRLLDSPHYGEKWGRHWLDLVRFAETNSYERDNPKPNAWRYRDYVIRALNADKPFDRFIREQLAGDELPDRGNDAWIATGYYRLGIWDDEPSDREQARYDALDDIVATTGQVFLGLTIDCARCHDHKLDPIPQKDYYRLLAFFQNVQHFRNGGPTDEVLLDGGNDRRRSYENAVRERDRKRAEIQNDLTEIEREFVTAKQVKLDKPDGRLVELIREAGAVVLGPERFARYKVLRRELQRLNDQPAPGEKALCVTESGPRAPDTFVLLRGNPHVTGERVEPGFPEVLASAAPVIPTPDPGAKTSGRRRVLADWIASADNPLTARVLANRVWQHHFGRGIVRSPNNFGVQGDKPTHPELLDFLAAELVRGGWRLKGLHRLIMTSEAYRRSSRSSESGLAKDPANDLCWRFDMRRLTGEEIRDSVLAVTGTLNGKMYGPGVFVEIPPDVLAGQSVPGKGWGKSPPDEQARRSVYIHVKRSLLTPILESFDLAETDRSTPVRFSTTQPTQALGMLNGTFLNQQAGLLAERVRREAGDDVRGQVARALALTTERRPTEAEVRRGLDLIDALRSRHGANPGAALRTFCLVALNLNEFLYLD